MYNGGASKHPLDFFPLSLHWCASVLTLVTEPKGKEMSDSVPVDMILYLMGKFLVNMHYFLFRNEILLNS